MWCCALTWIACWFHLGASVVSQSSFSSTPVTDSLPQREAHAECKCAAATSTRLCRHDTKLAQVTCTNHVVLCTHLDCMLVSSWGFRLCLNPHSLSDSLPQREAHAECKCAAATSTRLCRHDTKLAQVTCTNHVVLCTHLDCMLVSSWGFHCVSILIL